MRFGGELSVGLGVLGDGSGKLMNWGKIVGRGFGNVRVNLRLNDDKKVWFLVWM